MRWLVALLCLIPAQLPGAAPCTSKNLEKLNSGLAWLVAYPGAKSDAAHQFPGLTTYVTPKYTAAACEAHWTGVIAAKFTVNESGAVAGLRVENDPGHGMGEAVERAISTWRFTPALVNGHPLGMEAWAEFAFNSGDGHLSAPVPLQKYSPEEPEHSKRPAGPLVLSLVVDELGRPQNVKVTRSLGAGWDQPGVEAVRNWQFRPGTLDGHATAMATTVVLNFER